MKIFLITLGLTLILVLLCAAGLGISKLLTGKSRFTCKRCGKVEEEDKKDKKCGVCGKEKDQDTE